MPDLECLRHAILQRRRETPAHRALLVGISGIDGSGKGYISGSIAKSLSHLGTDGYGVALIGTDGWLNLPHIRFAREDAAEHFYQRAIRFDEMFEHLIVPLRDRREVDIEMDFTDETAITHRRHRYHFRQIDIVLLEGICLFKREYRPLFDLTCWIECSFETALDRAVKRCQEGLRPLETVHAFETVYFPAQQIHFERDTPWVGADLILRNELDDGLQLDVLRGKTQIDLPRCGELLCDSASQMNFE